MIPCFPDLFPDELFYSACARFSNRVNYPNNKTVCELLFGKKSAHAVVDLPCHLDAFITRLPYGHTYTVDILINQHTLFPLFAPFLPKDRADSIYELMISNESALIHRKLGTANSSLSVMPYFRYCPNCIKEDIATFGECYWHRSHQVRGFKICPKHLTFIENSSIPTRLFFRSPGFFSAERSKTNITPRIAEMNDPINIILVSIAKDIVYLLDHPGISLTPRQFIEQYQILLDQHNLLTQNRFVRQIDLIESFVTYYTPELLEQFHCTIYTSQTSSTWLARLVRVLRDIHPFLHHLLTVKFLGASIEDFFNKKMEPAAPLGKGPWPCLNPVCPYYNKSCIQTYQIRENHSKDSKYLGIFSCTCGFTYGRRGPNRTSSDIYHKDWVISYGEMWEVKFKELWFTPTLTRRQIARTFHISEESVTRQAAKLHLPTPRISPAMGGGRPPLIRDLASYRASWLDLLKEFPEASLSDLYSKAPGLYAWVRRNDREWFVEHRPLPKTPSQTFFKKNKSFIKEESILECNVDKDVDMAKKVKTVAHQLLTVPGPPKKISLRAISIHLPQIVSLRNTKPSTIPLTIQALNEVVETREQFAIRRIWFVMQQYQQEDLFPSRSSFAARAGIRSLLHVLSIQQAFEEAMSQICSIKRDIGSG